MITDMAGRLRYQGDGLNDEVSEATAKDCSHPIIVRPEFAPEADIKNILKKYGALPIRSTQPRFTETDYDADLTTALSRIERANKAFHALPTREREKYGSAAGLWQAYIEGKITEDTGQNEKTLDTPEHTP